MAEYTEITQLPGYVAAATDHQIALREAGEDEAAQLKAKLAWSEKTRELETTMRQSNEQHRSLEQAKAKIKEQYPDVAENIYIGAQTAEAMEATAKAFDDAVKEKVAAATPGTPPPPTTSTGQPPTGVGGDQAPVDNSDLDARKFDLAGKINDGKASRKEIEEYQDLKVSTELLPLAARARQEARRG